MAANPRNNRTFSELARTPSELQFYKFGLFWSMRGQQTAAALFFRSVEDRDAFRDIIESLGGRVWYDAARAIVEITDVE